MLTKYILAISLALPLLAMSATAQAGPTITDKNYWPNEARPIARWQGDYNSAFAYDREESRFRPAMNPYGRESTWRYQGR
jgi:hypothetical protein